MSKFLFVFHFLFSWYCFTVADLRSNPSSKIKAKPFPFKKLPSFIGGALPEEKNQNSAVMKYYFVI